MVHSHTWYWQHGRLPKYCAHWTLKPGSLLDWSTMVWFGESHLSAVVQIKFITNYLLEDKNIVLICNIILTFVHTIHVPIIISVCWLTQYSCLFSGVHPLSIISSSNILANNLTSIFKVGHWQNLNYFTQCCWVIIWVTQITLMAISTVVTLYVTESKKWMYRIRKPTVLENYMGDY